MFLFLPALKAEAGIFTIVKEVEAQTAGGENQPNTQTVQLLEGFSSPSLNDSTTAVVTIEGDGALMPFVGPMGTAADLGEEGLFDGQISVYVVREGDTLAAIAKMFGVSTNTIVWANDLDPKGKLKVGESLIILPITGVQYEVKKGDTLDSIAKKFGGDVTEIRRFNDLAVEDKLMPGNFLIIPNGDMHLAAAPAKKTTTAKNSATNLKTVVNGYFVRPIGPSFQWRKSQGYHGPYNAIDIASPVGTPVRAAAAGTVISAKGGGWNGGYGQIVIIAHDNGTQTLYAHLSRVATVTGARVEQGETIGQVGSTGRSTGPHLHFEIRGAAARPILAELY